MEPIDTSNEPEGAGEPVAEPTVAVSVLIPTLNEEGDVANTIAALRAQRFDGEVELLFIDGGSSDGTRGVLEREARRDGRIRVLDNPSRTTPHALNIGLAAARGEFVARMDAHSLPPVEYLSLGVERLRRGDVDWVSGPQRPAGRGRWSLRIALALSTRLGIGGASFRDPRQELETDTGFLGVWRRRTLIEHQGWDEGWPINQDSELAARVRAGGGRIVSLPAMAVGYIPRDSLRGLARQYWRYGQYRVKTSQAHPESMRLSHVLPPGLALATVAGAARARPLGPLARRGLAVYGLALFGTAASCLSRAPLRDAASVPLVLATMHLAWGFGFLAGSARFGPPLTALVRLARGRGR